MSRPVMTLKTFVRNANYFMSDCKHLKDLPQKEREQFYKKLHHKVYDEPIDCEDFHDIDYFD